MSATATLSSLGAAELLTLAGSLADAERLRPSLGVSTTRSWRTVVSTGEYEAFVIAWPVGGAVDLHDHGASAGAVVVVSGSLVETVVAPGRSGSLETATRQLGEGAGMHFAPGHVHDIANQGPGAAVSIHVYSPVLSTMTFFEPDHRSALVAVRTEEFGPPGSSR